GSTVGSKAAKLASIAPHRVDGGHAVTIAVEDDAATIGRPGRIAVVSGVGVGEVGRMATVAIHHEDVVAAIAVRNKCDGSAGGIERWRRERPAADTQQKKAVWCAGSHARPLDQWRKANAQRIQGAVVPMRSQG